MRIQFTVHRKSVVYAVSTGNPGIVLIFLIYSLVLCWGNVSNRNVNMKVALHYFFTFHHKMLGGTNDNMSPLVQTLGGHASRTPRNSVPAP